MEDKQNDILYTLEGQETFKAFCVSLTRYIAEDPRILLGIAKMRESKGHTGESWRSLYDQLQDENTKNDYAQRLEKIAKEYDWSEIQKTYIEWGKYGWITENSLAPLNYWDYYPTSQIDADKVAQKAITSSKIRKIIENIKTRTSNLSVFLEAHECYKNKHYTACSLILISLIDGELTRSQANQLYGNMKTGIHAEKRVFDELSKDQTVGSPGLIYLELLNYNSVINTIFENANGFDREPSRINRNYLHHGMSKRKVLKKDCTKLFLIYYQTLVFMKYQKEGT